MNSKIPLLYMPFILSFLFQDDYMLGFFIAWVGSVLILILTIKGFFKPLPKQLTFAQQIMRPYILANIIFVTFSFLTSVFYFIDANGYYYFTKNHYPLSDEQLKLIVTCQIYYSLCHAAYTHGLLYNINYNFKTKYIIATKYKLSNLILVISLSALLISYVFRFISRLEQLNFEMVRLSFIGSILSLTQAIKEKNYKGIAVSLVLFSSSFISAIYSGMKEDILVPMVLLSVFLYPMYKKTVLILGVVFISFFIYYVPTYTNIIREESWVNGLSSKEASAIAIAKIQNSQTDLADMNWKFLSVRLTEIKMFTSFVDLIPKKREYYNFQLIEQAFLSLLPRIFYPQKPITEKIVMERVFEAGSYNKSSSGSAKPLPIVDGYASFGILGVWFTGIILGLAASFLSRRCEYWFGGYLIGSAFMFSGLFQSFWKGNCFEFLLNQLFWSLIITWCIFLILKKIGILKQVIVKD